MRDANKPIRVTWKNGNHWPPSMTYIATFSRFIVLKHGKLIKEQIEEENVSRMARTIMEEDTRTIFDKAEAVLELLD